MMVDTSYLGVTLEARPSLKSIMVDMSYLGAILEARPSIEVDSTFADDVLFVGEWSECNVKSLVLILRCYHLSSGLKFKLSKSCIYGVGVPLDHVNALAHEVRCKGTIAIFGVRLTLLKSVLSSLPLYYFSLYKAPTSVLKIIESIRRQFFWGSIGDEKKMSWIKWSNVIAQKLNGGLGIGSLCNTPKSG
ncbi:hypothetical protein Tco_1070011 [Tanacetum coccineum]|uniref:Reverse transcriptase n=1 Tax=Tanacetum coccineum TaxID=301880 RepID=A0ABQ5HLA7_9ASTR